MGSLCQHVMVGSGKRKPSKETTKSCPVSVSWPRVSRRRRERKEKPPDVEPHPLDLLMQIKRDTMQIQRDTKSLDLLLEPSTTHSGYDKTNDPLTRDLLKLSKTFKR